MTIASWSDDLKIGEPEIDKEHWGLFALINDLHDKITDGVSEASVSSTLDALSAYVEVHFEHEERLMAESKYPDLETHKKAHKALEERVSSLIKDYEKDPKSFNYETFSEFLSQWLQNHIMKVDMAFAAYLRTSDRPS